MQSLYHLTRSLDPTRPVIGNDGWEAATTDVVAIHDYDADPARWSRGATATARTTASARCFAGSGRGSRCCCWTGSTTAASR